MAATFEMIRDFTAGTQSTSNTLPSFTFNTSTHTGSITYYSGQGKYVAVYYGNTYLGAKVRTRTCKNPATACDTLARLGVTEYAQLTERK